MSAVAEQTHRRTTAPRTRSGGLSRRLLNDATFMGESLRLLGFAALEFLALIRVAATTLLSLLGIPGVERAFQQVRWDATHQREWASRTGERHVSARYEELSPVTGGGLVRVRTQLSDPARARDLDWHLVNPIMGAASAVAPWILAVNGLRAFVVLWEWWRAGASAFYMGVEVGNIYTPSGDAEIYFVGMGVAQLMLAPLVARLMQRIHRRWVRFMLAGEVSEDLEERVRSLTVSRMTALDMQEAEIQRIERDLHDGAQARLVSIGMTVTQASRLIKHDPDATLALLEDVKNDSVIALQEIRTLVRGIRPPVLADRGLPDALRALAASNPMDARVTSTVEGRLVGAVESALFFAASELMTNATKHSSASRIAVELSEEAGDVVLEVMDDGLGGADGQDRPGGGIAGVRHRLAPFDGTLEIVSPVGGGTFATIRVPKPSEGSQKH